MPFWLTPCCLNDNYIKLTQVVGFGVEFGVLWLNNIDRNYWFHICVDSSETSDNCSLSSLFYAEPVIHRNNTIALKNSSIIILMEKSITQWKSAFILKYMRNMLMNVVNSLIFTNNISYVSYVHGYALEPIGVICTNIIWIGGSIYINEEIIALWFIYRMWNIITRYFNWISPTCYLSF